MLNTEVALQGQSVDGLDVDIGIAEDAPALIRVVTAVVKLVHRVGDVGAREYHRIGEHTVAIVNGDGGVLTHGGIRDATVVAGAIATVVPLGNHQVFAHAEHLTYIIGGVDAGRIAAVERVVHQTVLVDIVTREHIRAFGCAIAHAS